MLCRRRHANQKGEECGSGLEKTPYVSDERVVLYRAPSLRDFETLELFS